MLLTKCSKVWGRWDYFMFEVPYAYYAYFLETLIFFIYLKWIICNIKNVFTVMFGQFTLSSAE